ncbi:MAG: hypothetical protein IJY08_05820 [Clostridia bacterium]|nr:hypothetical protein [Clostridia bacterium]
MKEFAASIVLFICVIALVITNAIYIKNTATDIKSLALAVYESNGEDKAISDLKDSWESSKKIFALSISLREVDIITEYIIRLECAKIDGDDEELTRVYHLLCNAIDDATRYEKISFHTVF